MKTAGATGRESRGPYNVVKLYYGKFFRRVREIRGRRQTNWGRSNDVNLLINTRGSLFQIKLKYLPYRSRPQDISPFHYGVLLFTSEPIGVGDSPSLCLDMSWIGTDKF